MWFWGWSGGFSVWTLDVFSWVFFRYCGFLPQYKNMQGFIEELQLGVSMRVSGVCLYGVCSVFPASYPMNSSRLLWWIICQIIIIMSTACGLRWDFPKALQLILRICNDCKQLHIQTWVKQQSGRDAQAGNKGLWMCSAGCWLQPSGYRGCSVCGCVGVRGCCRDHRSAGGLIKRPRPAPVEKTDSSHLRLRAVLASLNPLLLLIHFPRSLDLLFGDSFLSAASLHTNTGRNNPVLLAPSAAAPSHKHQCNHCVLSRSTHYCLQSSSPNVGIIIAFVFCCHLPRSSDVTEPTSESLLLEITEVI